MNRSVRGPNVYKRPVILLFALLLYTVPGTTAESLVSSGRIEGTVRDPNDARVARATVSLLSANQATLRVAQTGSDGRFNFDGILPGSYEVLATHPNFSIQRQAVEVASSRATQITITLAVKQLAQQITVTAESGAALERESVAQQVNVIPDDAILQRTTALMAQVAEEEVGLALQRTSPTIGAVLVRGLTEVGVYIDGVRYTNSTQRGGINTFFNLNEPSNFRVVEVLRGPNTAQYGSDSLGGTAHLVTRQPQLGSSAAEMHGEINTFYSSADNSFGGNALVTYGGEKFGVLGNLASRRINTLRSGGGIDSHSAITRFLGLPSDTIGFSRLPDTGFTQYGGMLKLAYAPTANQFLSFHYQRSQQDGGKRYDQLLGGDGNLVADLRNLMLDFGYLRYFRQDVGFFDNLSATFSYNSQREERVNQGGNGNLAAAITHDRERTSSYGLSFHLDKQSSKRNTFLFGGDIYHDHVDAPSFSVDPLSNAVTIVRPRVPNGARYILAGAYLQDAIELVPEWLRLSGALRYNVASYRVRSADSPIVAGQPLVPDDSLRVGDFSGRIGLVATIVPGLNFAFNFSRGFRAPNITSLGSTGLVGVGYQVATSDLQGLNAEIGSTADESAVSTGVSVQKLQSETSNNYDFSLRYHNSRLETELTGFIIDYGKTIVRQTLILPQGAVGKRLGSQIIDRQLTTGAVFVPLSSSPVLVQANFGGTRLHGIEYTLNFRFSSTWAFSGHYSYVYAEDRRTGEAPNLGGGGIPPQTGFLSVRYQPRGERYWIEAYSTLAGRQNRLSSLDLTDRRTGATRSRANIQNFFRRGACVHGLTTRGTNGQCGTAGGTLIATGETLAQVQNRLLGTRDSAPLFTAIPGYGLVNLRGAFRFNDYHEVMLDFENIADKSYRAPGWGTDGPGRSVTVRYRMRF